MYLDMEFDWEHSPANGPQVELLRQEEKNGSYYWPRDKSA